MKVDAHFIFQIYIDRVTILASKKAKQHQAKQSDGAVNSKQQKHGFEHRKWKWEVTFFGISNVVALLTNLELRDTKYGSKNAYTQM